MTQFSTPGNVTTLQGIFQYANNVTGNAFGVSILMMIFCVAFITQKQASADQRGTNARIFLSSMFITMLCSVFLFIQGLVGDYVMYVCIAGTALGLFASLVSGND